MDVEQGGAPVTRPHDVQGSSGGPRGPLPASVQSVRRGIGAGAAPHAAAAPGGPGSFSAGGGGSHSSVSQQRKVHELETSAKVLDQPVRRAVDDPWGGGLMRLMSLGRGPGGGGWGWG
jgi:hypothetical protein